MAHAQQAASAEVHRACIEDAEELLAAHDIEGAKVYGVSSEGPHDEIAFRQRGACRVAHVITDPDTKLQSVEVTDGW